ncbi:MAG: hypothetical protein L6Q55_02815 [Azonexus sp.]|nr:calcium-binding protein [Azonexus sp.]MCK6411340.1 hypothetical protein [Azonexus sp.]
MALTGTYLISKIKTDFGVTLAPAVERAYATKLQDVINANPTATDTELDTLLVNALLKLSLVKAKLVEAFDENGNGKIDTLAELNISKLALDGTVDAAQDDVANGGGAAPGQTFTLTTGTNNFTGTSGSDTFDAGLSSSSLQTLNSGDRLDGGAGTDDLVAVINGSVTPAALTSVENVMFTTVTNSATLDLTNSTGLSTVTSAGATGAGNTVTIQGVSKAVGITIRDTALAHTVTYNDVTGTADTATVNVGNLSQATGVVTSILGVETLTLNVTGNSSNTVAGTGIGTLTATQTAKLNVTGDKALNIVDNLEAQVVTVDASAASGGVNLDFNGTNMTVTGGAGNDDFSFEAAGNVSVNGGAGNDIIRFDAVGTFTTADTVNGGDGTDTLSATSANLVTVSAATPATYTVTNVETIQANTAVANGAAITLGNISTTANRLNLTAANAGTSTFNFNAGASTLSNAVATVGAIAVDAAGTAADDSLTIVHGAASAVDSLNGQALTSTDFETVTINTTGTGAAGAQTVGTISVTATGTASPTLNITGTNALTTGVITATGGVINASGMTASAGTAALTMVTGQNTANTITGSAGDDILFGAITTGRNQTIDGGAGNDSITAGAGNDVLTGGEGVDTIDGGAGNDSIDGGAGNDRIVISADANLAAGDTIVGGEGTDTIAFTANMTDGASTLQAISGFEILEIASGATDTLTLSNFISNQTFTRVNFGDAGGGNTLTANNAGAAVTDVYLLAGIAGDTAVFDRLVDNTSNSLNISARADLETTDVVTLTIDDEETVTISGSAATSDFHVGTLNAADMTSLTITGAADVLIDNAVSSTILATVNASASTGAVEVHANNSVVAMTMTAGSGTAEFTGGALADNITGGIANDTIIGGGGADTINAGAGDDRTTGGNSADVINVGAGTDTLVLSADAQTAVSTLATGNTSATVELTGADVVTGMAAGDIIDVEGLGYTLVGANAANTLLAAGNTSLTDGLVDNTFELVRGSWVAGTTTGSGTFIQSATGNDTLFVIDADQTTGGQSYEAVVLVGVGATLSGTATTVANTIITLA